MVVWKPDKIPVLWSKMSGTQMGCLSHDQTIWKLDKKSGKLNIQMNSIQIVTLLVMSIYLVNIRTAERKLIIKF